MITLDSERPAAGHVRGGPSDVVTRGGERRKDSDKLTFRIEPDGDPVMVAGREAQTLWLLIQTGERGFTSGEASPFGWARRTSGYVFRLRRRGLDIMTAWELIGDARVGRYILKSPVVLLSQEEVQPCA